MKDNFSITSRVIAQLGEELIKNENIAILEIVKNSYDAMATECEVFFHADTTEDNLKITSISITDNGDGMDIDIIKNNWLVIGTDNKKKVIDKETLSNKSLKRLPLGEKGVGRLGVHKLGNKITLISKKIASNEVTLTIDWTLLETVKEVKDFKIDITESDVPTYFKNEKHGTKIIIEELKTEWSYKKLRECYRNLLSLNSPYKNTSDEFNVTIDSNKIGLFDGLPTFDDIKEWGMYFGHCKLSGKNIIEFNYSFKPWKTLKKIDEGRVRTEKDLIEEDLIIQGEREIELSTGKTKRESYDVDLNKNKVGTVEFDIVIFEPDTQILNFMNLEKKAFRDYLKTGSGIRVYRDDVRIYDYGEPDDDWLEIDKQRIHRLGGNISNQIVMGAVRLNRVESKGLIEKTNREGFVENDAYIDLCNAVKYVLSLFVRERNVDKAILSTLYKNKKIVEPVLSDLNEVENLIQNKVKNDNDKKEMLHYINRINEQYLSVRDTLLRSANAGLNLGAVIHEIEKQIASLKGSIIHQDIESVKKISNNLDMIIRRASVLLKKSDVKKQDINKVVKDILEGFEFRFQDHKISVYKYFESSELISSFANSAVISSVTNLLDNSIFWLSYTKNKSPKIAIYTTSQLRDFNSIIIADNGPGFNIPTDIATEPFISGKPNNMGSGLGLHICSEMMKAVKGELRFCEIDDFDIPEEMKKEGITKTIIALCLPKNGV